MPTVNISKLNIQITGSSQGLATAVNQANQALSQLGNQSSSVSNRLKSSFAELDKILLRSTAIYGIYRAANFGRDQLFDAVRLAADAEQAQIAFEVLLGSAEEAATAINGLYDFVETTPFRLEEVRNSAKMLAAFGIENKKILPTLRSLGDIAAGTGNRIEDLAELYGKTAVENRLYTRDLNQFVSRGIDLLSILADQFGVPKEEIRKLAEEGRLYFSDIEQAIASLTGEGGRFFGLTQRQAQTTAGEYSNFLDEVDALKREFGTGLLPVLRDFVAVMRELIGAGDESGQALEDFKEAGKTLGEAMRITASAIVFVRAGLNDLVRQVSRLLGILAPLLDKVSGSDFSAFFDEFDRGLTKSIVQMRELGLRLGDLSEPIIDRTQLETTIKGFDTLADILDQVGNDAIRARNALKALNQDAKAFAEEITKNYASPLEEFETAVRKIIQANLLGALSDNFATRAIREEVEKLYAATEKLRDLLTSNPAIERGSQADILARFQARFRRPGINGENVDEQTVRGIIERIQAELQGQLASLENLANAADKAAESLNKISDTEEVNRKAKAEQLLRQVERTITELYRTLDLQRLEIKTRPGRGTISEFFFGKDKDREALEKQIAQNEKLLADQQALLTEIQAEITAMNELKQSTDELKEAVQAATPEPTATPSVEPTPSVVSPPPSPSTPPPVVSSPFTQEQTNKDARLLLNFQDALKALADGGSSSRFRFAASLGLRGASNPEVIKEIIKGINANRNLINQKDEEGLDALIKRMEEKLEKQQQQNDNLARLNRSLLQQIANNTAGDRNRITVRQYSA